MSGSKQSNDSKKKLAAIKVGTVDSLSTDPLVVEEFEPVQEEVRKKFKFLELSPTQMTANLILNFLNEICFLDDKITAK